MECGWTSENVAILKSKKMTIRYSRLSFLVQESEMPISIIMALDSVLSISIFDAINSIRLAMVNCKLIT